MFLLEPDHTQFDLRWRMFGTDIRVHPMFWLVSGFLGWAWFEAEGFPALFLWVVWVFVSILLHEFGHVLAGRLFGRDGHIVLFSFGGLAVGSSNLASRWQRIVVYFAGPLVQLILYAFLRWGLIYFLIRIGVRHLSRPAIISLDQLLEINLFWPLLNLLPIWPLDGGKITRELFDWLSPGRGIKIALGVSLAVAGFLAVNALAGYAGHPLIVSEYVPSGDLYIALLFGLLAFSNFQELQQMSSKPWREEYPNPWEQDADDWKRSRR